MEGVFLLHLQHLRYDLQYTVTVNSRKHVYDKIQYFEDFLQRKDVWNLFVVTPPKLPSFTLYM